MVGPGLICSLCHEDATFSEMIDENETHEKGVWICRRCRKKRVSENEKR